MDKAGAYAVQEHGDLIIERVEGSYTNVVGLPTELLSQHLSGWLPMPVRDIPYSAVAYLGEIVRHQPPASPTIL
jgi:hypothetical protein